MMTMMKRISVCHSEEAIKVSDFYSSGPSNLTSSSSTSAPSSVTCVYRVNLATGKQFLAGITWSNLHKPGFAVGVSEFPVPPSDIGENYSVLHGPRGAKVFQFDGLKIEVLWDLSRAEYSFGPEPKSRFYITISVNSKRALFLGDTENGTEPTINPSLISRRELFSGTISSYSTRVRFSDTGSFHDIVIKYSGGGGGGQLESPVLGVSIDKRKVVEVKRLKWNFRGNETIFIDGLVIDLMWDVHDLLFNWKTGYGVFLFRTRSGLESRVWLEEKELGKLGFSLIISGCKKQN